MAADRPGRTRPEPSAYQRALGLLVRREHSRRELGRKLELRGVAPEEADAALETLARQSFQSDERFAAALARSRAAAGYGPARIRAELSGHALTRDQVAAALAACEGDWAALARQALARRFGATGWQGPVRRRKAVEFLLRRGFDRRDAFSAVGQRGEDEE